MFHQVIFPLFSCSWAGSVSRETMGVKTIKIKDHFLSKEDFFLVNCSKGVLKTEPYLNSKVLAKYYNSDEYISHGKGSGFLASVYSFFSRLMLFFKFKIVKKYSKKDSLVVDFGCGIGDFIYYLKERGQNVLGVENNQKALQECKKKNLNVVESISHLNKKIDLIIFWHSFEHISNPKSFLEVLKKSLNTNSTVVIALPNYMSFDSQYYKTFWAGYDVPRHRFHYSILGIKETMSNHGFRFVESKPLFLDAFYVSMLSEKYKKSKFFFVKGLAIGLLSNLLAFFNSRHSSNVFVFKSAV